MTKIKETVLIIVGAIFAGFGVWEFVAPIDEATVIQLVEIVFAILGAIGVGAGLRGKWVSSQVSKYRSNRVNGLLVGHIGEIGDK